MNSRWLKALYYKIRNSFYLERKHGRKVLQDCMRRYSGMRNPDIQTLPK